MRRSSRESTIPSAERHSRRSAASSPLVVDLDDDEQCQFVARSDPPRPITRFPGFRKGNIVKIQMKNFLTFTNTAIHPGPCMNVILGPNGTGKSTVVNAVCIAFAGNPKLLGRSPDLGAFVKHGEDRATVEAILYDPDLPHGTRTVTRSFDTDGKSYFEIDGERARQSDVISKVNRVYDIQLDNLSQFMPQEKIADFVNHKPEELLAIAVRSLGGTEKEREFEDLTSLDRTVSNFAQELNQKEAKLSEMLEQQAAEEAEVQAYRQQKQAQRRLKLYKKYLPYLESKQLKFAFVHMLSIRKQAEEEAAVLHQEYQRIQAGALNGLQQEVDAARETFLATKEASKVLSNRASALIGEVDRISVVLSEKSKAVEDLEGRHERHQKRIGDTKVRLAQELQQAQEQDGPVSEHTIEEESARLRAQKDRIRNDYSAENARKGPIDQRRQTSARKIKHYNHRLSQLGDVRQERIRALSRARNAPRHLGDCDMLVRDMKASGAFRGHVFGPVAAEIEADNPYHARIMAACVSGFIMTAFVTETARDSRLLMSECRKRFSGWSPDIISAPTTSNDEPDDYAIRSQVPARPVDDKLRRLGIVSVVSDIFQCPPVVRAALNAQVGLHNIHVGSEQCDTFRDELRREDGVQAWFSPTSRCQVLRSRFDASVRNLSVETSFATRRGSLFEGSMNETVQEKNRLGNMIREEEDLLRHAGQQMQDVEGRLENLSANLREINGKLQEAHQRRQARRQRAQKIEKIKSDLQSYVREAASQNVEKEKVELGKEIQRLQDDSNAKIPSAVVKLKKLRDTVGRLDEQLAKRLDAERRLEAEQASHSAFQAQINEKRREVEQAKKASKEARGRWKAKLAEAKEVLPQQQIDANPEFFDVIAEKDVEWLTQEIARQEGEVEGLGSGGRQAVLVYEHRQHKIDKLQNDVDADRATNKGKMEGLKKRKLAFLDWLQAGINKMRAKFSNLYRRLGCAGDLELANKDSERIGDLELQILVSYRDDAELRPISFSGNSGGEKMCCTMLFCFSLLLEEERIPPFVFVDELNQGLDPSNEMKIMTMMFEDARSATAPQSFVITPKLLLDLPFHEQTKTHIIFNGSVTGKLDVTAATGV
ncbi:unnamed protein product [Chondrus crispus]|uniref:Structural maintenance of chromosomes protein 5 n=1 Tax=Chondrus crispus TaxID=2769 RepID=R7Q3T2_CHOCR|nr:unnamed protein product [Chondrus crispus]CDF32689.1 unnamed protein product [Chondrus crispus]|eukprot:XP_005712460.1 unnamed protein product [Chondrus crispus]